MAPRVRGAKPRFSAPHVLLSLLLLSQRNYGRYVLSEYLNLSLASTRTLLEKLIVHNYAVTSGQNSGRRGTALSDMGYELVQAIKQEIVLLSSIEFPTILQDSNEYQHATFLLRMKAPYISNGIKERDRAIRAGAEGAITLVKRNERWVFPDTSEPLSPQPSLIQGNDNDVLIHVFARTKGGALIGGASAGFPLVSKEIQQDLDAIIQ